MRDDLLWMDPYKISEWAYYQCRDIKDELKGDLSEKEEAAYKARFAEMKAFIEHSFWAACFIVNIEDDVKMIDLVTNEQDALMLSMCKNIEQHVVKLTDTQLRENLRREHELLNATAAERGKPEEKQAGWFRQRMSKLKNLGFK